MLHLNGNTLQIHIQPSVYSQNVHSSNVQSVAGSREYDESRAVSIIWGRIQPLVQVNISCHHSVLGPRSQNGRDRLNLPAIGPSIMNIDILYIVLCDAAVRQTKVSDEAEYPEVTLVRRHVVPGAVIECGKILFVIDVDIEVWTGVRASIS